ncbi:hypothetical protein [Streptomyces lycii]|uniref:HNH endonuclease n=1 Tax=Streptomyces lycii TaxID=2654337 RepID=A0ABQ7FPQ3_9ACTN|nr:hypothetical protein [Streptomyces lycii]KAF4410911.1 hypothetical protein GCU69_01440 [Streptomyces lycii]
MTIEVPGARRVFVQLDAGVLIEGAPAPAGVRVQCPDDIAEYLIAQQWAHSVKGPHIIDRGTRQPLIWRAVRSIPGASVPLDEWPSWMRPAWMRASGRVKQWEDGKNIRVAPAACPGCKKIQYVRHDKLPDDSEPARRGDGFLARCRSCRNANVD